VKVRRLFRAKDVAPVAPTRASEPVPGLDDWEGHWPEDDTTPGDDRPGDVPMLLNPNSPNIAPS
jgi:hypothetical protein